MKIQLYPSRSQLTAFHRRARAFSDRREVYLRLRHIPDHGGVGADCHQWLVFYYLIAKVEEVQSVLFNGVSHMWKTVQA